MRFSTLLAVVASVVTLTLCVAVFATCGRDVWLNGAAAVSGVLTIGLQKMCD